MPILLGDLMPYVGTDFVTYNKGLHNHGEEPDRPGYSIQELYYLIRSSFPMQVVTALNTLAAILEKVFNISVHNTFSVARAYFFF